MKTRILIFAILLGLLLGCSKDDSPTPQQPDLKSGVEKSSSKQLTGFAFRAADNAALETDVIGTIDQQARAITASVPTGTDVTALLPEMEVSPKALVSPKGMANFKDSLNYTVTAEDGSTAMYAAVVNIAASSEKQILSFRFEGIVQNGVTVDITAEIDEDNKTIRAIMPSGTDITVLEPSIEISTGAMVALEGPQDFTDPINYTVTAGDGTSTTYLVHTSVALTEKEVLLLIARENPGNTLVGWTKENNLEDFEGVVTAEGKVVRLSALSKGLTVLPPGISHLLNLKVLDLSSNELTTIPPEIGLLVRLTELDLRGNQIDVIPPEIGQLTNLTKLSLYVNHISVLPAEIGQLVNLNILWLNSNSLTALPPEIGQLVNLTELILDHNRLTTLPPEIGKLVNLSPRLDLSFNRLSSLPPEIGQLINLRHLDFFKNQLKTVPAEIGQLGNLKSLDLQYNKLESLPPEIGQLTGLEDLRLSGNGLTKIPNEVCQLDTSNGGTTKVDIVPGVLCEFILGDPLPTIPDLGLD